MSGILAPLSIKTNKNTMENTVTLKEAGAVDSHVTINLPGRSPVLLKGGDTMTIEAPDYVELRRQRDQLLAALYKALPFVEDHEGNQVYKPGAVKACVKTIRDAIDEAEKD